MALDLALVLGLDEKDHLDVGQPDLVDGQAEERGGVFVFLGRHFPVGDEIPFDLQVAGVGRPGEIMDHGLPVRGRRRAGGFVHPGLRGFARGPDDETARDGDVDDEIGEVGEELRVLMVGVAVPALALLVDAGLGEPLADEEGVPVVSRPGHGPGDLAPEFDPQMNALPGLDGRGEQHPGDGLVPLRLRAVRRDEGQRGLEVRAVGETDVRDVDPTPFAVLGAVAPAEQGLRPGLAKEGAVLVLERVPVEVEEHVGDGVLGGIGPDDLFLAEKHLAGRVELDPDLIMKAGRAGGGSGRGLPWRPGGRQQDKRRPQHQAGPDDLFFHVRPLCIAGLNPSTILPRRPAGENR